LQNIQEKQGLEIEVIAEGVEKQEQKEFLMLQNCDEIQGWIYSKALKENSFVDFVKNFS
jgi:sensor c-di-GMP phosphodiesterase-like protein